MSKPVSVAVSVSATVPTRLTQAVANRLVTSANMKVGAYTVANAGSPYGELFYVSVTHTTATGTDTLGTIDVVGTDRSGAVIRETLTPTADATVVGTKLFQTVTSVTGVGWVISGGNDTLTVGVVVASVGRRRVRVHNAGGQILYLGASDVATTTGTSVPAGGVIDFNSVDPYDLFGLSASGALDVRVLSVW